MPPQWGVIKMRAILSVRSDFGLRHKRQRGIAAIEFSLILLVLLLILVAVVGYGTIFWMQQQLTQAAGDGARAALQARYAGNSNVSVAACTAAQATFAAGTSVSCNVTQAACAWPGTGGASAACASIRLSYNVQTWPLLQLFQSLMNILPGARSNWIPSTLAAKVTIQISKDYP